MKQRAIALAAATMLVPMVVAMGARSPTVSPSPAGTTFGRETPAHQSVSREANDLTGLWHLTLTQFGQPSFEARAELKSEGPQVTGIAAAGAARIDKQ